MTDQTERIACATCGRPLTFVVHRYFHVLGSAATNDRRPWDHEPVAVPVPDRREPAITESEMRALAGDR